MAGKQWVYLFSEIKQAESYVNNDWDKVRGLLGGKGANLAEMVRIGLPVPPGFTVTTEACNAYQVEKSFPAGMWEQMLEALAQTEKDAGKNSAALKIPLGFLPFRRQILHAWYDGHRPKHRLKR
jgi:pyruvate,orthophosphate dikinase